MLDDFIGMFSQWGHDRKITTNGSSISQAAKTVEETGELLAAILNKDKPEIEDAIGDIIVTLVMVADIEKIDMHDALSRAWESIKDRKGHLDKSGTFIKEK